MEHHSLKLTFYPLCFNKYLQRIKGVLIILSVKSSFLNFERIEKKSDFLRRFTRNSRILKGSAVGILLCIWELCRHWKKYKKWSCGRASGPPRRSFPFKVSPFYPPGSSGNGYCEFFRPLSPELGLPLKVYYRKWRCTSKSDTFTCIRSTGIESFHQSLTSNIVKKKICLLYNISCSNGL